MPSIAFYTLGCKVNQCESDAMIGLFKNKGYELVDFSDIADIYVINTCTVTKGGARKSRQIIRRAIKRNPQSIVVAVGCYPQVAVEEIKKIKGVDLILGTRDKNKIFELVENMVEPCQSSPLVHVSDINKINEYEEISPFIYNKRTRAFIKVQEGCNQYCSYCIIPYARGPIRSRKVEEVLYEAEKLSSKGFKEVVLTGIHLGAYGKGRYDERIDDKEIDLLYLLQELTKLEKIKRIRLSSIEPTEISAGLIDMIKNNEKICPHLHIPLQSGSKEILEKMNRPYTPEEFKAIVKNIREEVRDISITTDIMVGFPGETKEHFNETLTFVKEIGFSSIHVFKYSLHSGTVASTFPNQVPSKTKDKRSRILTDVAKKQECGFYEKYLGETLKVLVEQEYGKRENHVIGYTQNYIPVFFEGNIDLKGTIQNIKLMGIY
ncbi:MAG TPA: tRNA (N(6)-L-threonylcarbamoyladenosine(37)-C(2))-methylthiotransferase MtaB, partial [Thermoanaerobacterales bacterium]|nr:tRNA (N(6)-L-threonylcarbamoyladenosine(37)-C(2))-methylthiotransferase MtaB [Thermoanaerobacterales bacterium]